MATTSDDTWAYAVHIVADGQEFDVDIKGKAAATKLADAVLDAAESGHTYRFDPGGGATVVINFANVGRTLVVVVAGQGGAINIRR
jgi:hypothetical protein